MIKSLFSTSNYSKTFLKILEVQTVERCKNGSEYIGKTRRLKSFPWDALVHGSIMAFYLKLEKLGKPERCVML